MGANIGTTVTNTLVALAHMRQSEEFKRAFSAATVHDFFNLMAVSIILPIELATNVLSNSAEKNKRTTCWFSRQRMESPIKKWVKEPVGWLKDLGDAIGASGNVLGTLLVAIGLVIILISLAFITKNMRKLVADRIDIP